MPAAFPTRHNPQRLLGGRYSAGGLTWDAVDSAALGDTPNGRNWQYMGFAVLMRPSVFLLLSHDLGTKEDGRLIRMRQAPATGKVFAPQQLYFEEFAPKQWRVQGHEGRHRALMVQEQEGDTAVPVLCYMYGSEHARPYERRARDITEAMLRSLVQGARSQDGDFVLGPLFRGPVLVNGREIQIGASRAAEQPPLPLRQNPAPVPVNMEVVRACHAQIVSVLEDAVRKAPKKAKTVLDLMDEFGGPLRFDVRRRILIGTFSAPVWMGRHRPPLYREVPVYLKLSVKDEEKDKKFSKMDLFIGGSVTPPKIPFDAPQALYVNLNALYPLFNWGYITHAGPNHKMNHNTSRKLLTTLVHEFTHACDYVVSRAGPDAMSGALLSEHGRGAYFNAPIEMRARYNEYLQSMLADWRRDAGHERNPEGYAQRWLDIVFKHLTDAGYADLTPANQARFKDRLLRLAREEGIP